MPCYLTTYLKWGMTNLFAKCEIGVRYPAIQDDILCGYRALCFTSSTYLHRKLLEVGTMLRHKTRSLHRVVRKFPYS